VDDRQLLLDLRRMTEACGAFCAGGIEHDLSRDDQLALGDWLAEMAERIHKRAGLSLLTSTPLRRVEGSNTFTWVHLTDSLSNLGTPLLRLATTLDEVGGPENTQVNGDARGAIVAQSGAVDPGLVRLQAKENRILTPGEVAELVEAYCTNVEPGYES
jgi:hypothetical protein